MVKDPDVATTESIVGATGNCATKTDVRVGAVKDRSEMAFVARSEIDPLLRSTVVATEIPSVSNSIGSVVTVYLKVAVFESVSERKVAYLVEEPTVKVRRGAPVTVTDSLKTIVKVGVWLLLYVELAGGETDEIVGAVRSILIGVDVGEFEVGPLSPEATDLIDPAMI